MSFKPELLKCNTCANCLGLRTLEGTRALALRCKLQERVEECMKNDFSLYMNDPNEKANNLVEDYLSPETKEARDKFDNIERDFPEIEVIDKKITKGFETLFRLKQEIDEISALDYQLNQLKELAKEKRLFISTEENKGETLTFRAIRDTTVGVRALPHIEGPFVDFTIKQGQIFRLTCERKLKLNPLVKDLLTESLYNEITASFGTEAYEGLHKGRHKVALRAIDFEIV